MANKQKSWRRPKNQANFVKANPEIRFGTRVGRALQRTTASVKVASFPSVLLQNLLARAGIWSIA